MWTVPSPDVLLATICTHVATSCHSSPTVNIIPSKTAFPPGLSSQSPLCHPLKISAQPWHSCHTPAESSVNGLLIKIQAPQEHRHSLIPAVSLALEHCLGVQELDEWADSHRWLSETRLNVEEGWSSGNKAWCLPSELAPSTWCVYAKKDMMGLALDEDGARFSSY